MMYSHQLENGITLCATQRGDYIEFTNSSTGGHRIDAGSTEERVKAHWEGYVRTAERHVEAKLAVEKSNKMETETAKDYYAVSWQQWVGVYRDRLGPESKVHLCESNGEVTLCGIKVPDYEDGYEVQGEPTISVSCKRCNAK